MDEQSLSHWDNEGGFIPNEPEPDSNESDAPIDPYRGY